VLKIYYAIAAPVSIALMSEILSFCSKKAKINLINLVNHR